MHKYFSFIGLSFICLFCCSCSKKYYQNEGIYSLHSFFLNYIDSTKLPIPLPNMESKLWVKDSFVIFEVKSINEFSVNDTLKRIGYDFYKYTFLNLKTKTCQDYKNLSDTALPICNYFLGPDECILWDISGEIDSLGISKEAKMISDTIIKNKKLKRIRTDEMPFIPEYSFVYYLECPVRKSIVHLCKKLDDIYPKCQVVMTELIEKKSDIRYLNEVKCLREKLESSELAVFAEWEKNSINTKLPLLTFNAAGKKFAEKFSTFSLDSIKNK
jgi:hypothetical protein